MATLYVKCIFLPHAIFKIYILGLVASLINKIHAKHHHFVESHYPQTNRTFNHRQTRCYSKSTKDIVFPERKDPLKIDKG